ncbi:hypothetical protein, partial [Ralstonia pseudosolanacearum]
KRPHLSAVCLLKNCAINFVYRVAALSAAEKRDYAELSSINQTISRNFFSSVGTAHPSQPLRSHFHPAVTALLRVAGSEY